MVLYSLTVLKPVICSNKTIEWTDTQLYLDMLGRIATRAGLGVTCDSTEEGLSTMVSGVPKVFETFVMMCVSRILKTVFRVAHVCFIGG